MNFQQKTRLIELELINAGLKDSRLRLDPHELALAASQLAVVHDFPTDGSPSVGMGGQTSEGWLRGHRTTNPGDFEGAGANVNNPNNKGGGGAESLLEKSARISGLSVEEFNKKDPAFKHAAADEAQGDTGYVWHGEVKTAPYAGMDPKTLAGLSLEDRLAAANDAYFKAVEAHKPGARS